MPVHRRWRSARPTRRAVDRHTLLRVALLALLAPALVAVATAPARAERPNVYAITGATVVDRPGNVLEATTVIVRDGLIEAVGTDLTVPADAEAIDGEGLTVWAGWIDAYSHLAMRQPQGGQGGGGFDIAALFQQGQPQPGTGHPIELVHPQHRVTSELVAGDGEIEKRREVGFTAALAVPRDGIFRGWSALVSLRDGHPRDLVIDPVVAQHLGFDRGSFFGGYPSDLLGSIATVRQVHYDLFRYAEWQARYESDPTGMRRPDYNDAYDALMPVLRGSNGVIVHAGGNRMIERTLRLAEEFQVAPMIYGSGYEYEILEMLRGTEASFIVPVDFPDDPDVSSPERLPAVSLQSLQRWEKAAGNAAALEGAGITFALTPYGMGNASKFTENVRKAIDAGLTETTALAALTTVPAAMLGASTTLGTVAAGKIANLAFGPPFAEDTEIRHVFVDGHHFEMEEKEQVGDPDAVVDPRGEWAVTANIMGNAQESTWTIEGTPGNYSGRSVGAQGTQDFDSVTLEGNALTVGITSPMGSLEVTVVIEGDELTGSASIDGPGGQTFTIGFTGERISGPEGGAR